MTSITKHEQTPWQLPTDPKLNGNTLPLWLSTWGFVDWEKNAIGYNIDTDYVCIIVSHHIKPAMGWYLPLDEDFLQGRSKYQPVNTQPNIYDKQHWHPKVTMQLTSLNSICSSGPGTIKLPKQISAEAHAKCTFYFKLGGCGPTTQTIDNPKTQPIFPTPNNLLQQPSLQSPAIPFETYLYSFDKRRDFFTKRAIERLQKYSSLKETVSSFTDSNKLHPIYSKDQETPTTDSEEETEEKTLLLQLQQQRNKQQQFRERILQLLHQLST